MATARSYKCSLCSTSFTRSEHLQRHSNLHTGAKPFQCPCGEKFSRNDVLAQHQKKCEMVLQCPQIVRSKEPKIHTRTRRACDQCALAKARCDNKEPCARCRMKSTTCTYTRRSPGRNEQTYAPRHPGASAAVPASFVSSNPHKDERSDEARDLFFVQPIDVDNEAAASSSNTDDLPRGALLQHSEIPPIVSSGGNDFYSPSLLTDHWRVFDCMSNDFDLGPLLGACSDLDSLSSYVDRTSPCVPLQLSQPQSILSHGAAIPPSPQVPQPLTLTGFSLEQIDPVEARCQELRNLLKMSEPLVVTDEMISAYITRENILAFCRTYGEYFQRNYPIVHMPTFKLAETAPILLLAVMLGGACCSDGQVSSAYITKFAMQILILVQTESHESQMGVPALSTIQASMISCAVLICCRNETASKFVTPFLARNLSMARRASLFDVVNSTAYCDHTNLTFDWQLWIEQETRRRIACKIFCQDVVSCIFQGGSLPAISPHEFDIEMPCYEACWEAKTASECLHALQNMPSQMRVSAAIRELRKSTVHDDALFEASGFGMFVLVKGLHCLLYHASQCDPELFFQAAKNTSADSPSTPQLYTESILYRLQQDLSGSAISSLADDVVSSHSYILKHVNDSFNAWRTTWDMRRYRERTHEDHFFFSDPLPSWWLGKLYLILHCHSSFIPSDSEFAVWRASGANESEKLKTQAKIRKWMAQFRNNRHQPNTSTQTYLSKLLKFSEHG